MEQAFLSDSAPEVFEVVQQLQAFCIQRGITLAVAESLTAGLIGATLAQVPGSSAYFLGGVICYNAEVKRKVLGVDSEIIERYGVVSRMCAEAMARGVRRVCDATVSLAVTGEAGPLVAQRGTEVGTVWVAVSLGNEVVSHDLSLNGNRNRIRELTATQSIALLYQTISAHGAVRT